MRKELIITLLFVLFLFSCKKKQDVTCDGSNPKYNSEVKTIINNNCMPCHGPGGSDDDYSTYQNILPVLNNGDFEKEVLKRQTMPTNKTMSKSDLSKIKCWVENGYLEN